MKKAILITSFLFSFLSYAQVGINTDTPDESAALDITSTTRGLLPPRMTQEQREAISSPAAGLTVYQTNGNAGLYLYDGSSWGVFNSTSNISLTQMSAKSPSSMSYFQALQYCAQLTENGYDDWKLPTYDEWQNYIENSSTFPPSDFTSAWVKINNSSYLNLLSDAVNVSVSVSQYLTPDGFRTSNYQSSSGRYFCHCLR